MHKNLFILFMALLVVQPSFAEGPKIGRCGLKFFNALSRLEMKSPPTLFETFILKISKKAAGETEMVAKTELSTKIQKIENIEAAIVQKRRILSFYKSYSASNAHSKRLQALENQKYTLKDDQGKDVEYRVKRLDTLVNEVVDFDTADLNLEAQKVALRNHRHFKASDETKNPPLTLPSNKADIDEARKFAGHKELIPVAKERNESVQYGLYAVTSSGTEKKPEFVVSLNTKSSTSLIPGKKVDQEGEFSLDVKDVSSSFRGRTKELKQLSEQITERFQLDEARS